MNLVAIPRSGEIISNVPLTEAPRSIISQTVQMYGRRGYVEPWIGDLAAEGHSWVGCCGFTAPPAGRVVEIAYQTFSGFEGRGIATAMARHLVAIARQSDPSVSIIAHTLTEENSSNRTLKKLGFVFAGTVNDPEDGNIWEWRYEPQWERG